MARKTKLEKIETISKEIEALQKEHNDLLKLYKEQERKARTNRLCSRGGYLESRLPETITLTDNQYKVLLETTLFSDKGRTILDWVKDKNITNIGINPETQKRQVTLDNGETHDIQKSHRRQENTLRSNGALIYHNGQAVMVICDSCGKRFALSVQKNLKEGINGDFSSQYQNHQQGQGQQVRSCGGGLQVR